MEAYDKLIQEIYAVANQVRCHPRREERNMLCKDAIKLYVWILEQK